MALDLIGRARFTGPAFPEPFVALEMEKELSRLKLLPRPVGAEGQQLQQGWSTYRNHLRSLGGLGGHLRVLNHVVEPLLPTLGYASLESTDPVQTREGEEPGGYLLRCHGRHLRVWTAGVAEDLDAPTRRGRAFRFSHGQVARRVLAARGERLGLLSNGLELRLLVADPARTDSQVEIPVDPDWKRSREAPDTYRFVLALARPEGVEALPELVEKARLQQTTVTRELRRQAREAVERFVQEVLDHPDNRTALDTLGRGEALARQLWHEGLVLVYRLLVILKLEATDDPARALGFASCSLWRGSFSPSVALARFVAPVLRDGLETGRLLEEGLRTLFRLFADGLSSTELNVRPLGGALFGAESAPLLDSLRWGERAVAHLLDRLLWTSYRRGGDTRERVHYGPLAVEDLGRVYEALLEREPGLAVEPMCRLRRAKLEVVVTEAQGERYRPAGHEPADESEATEEAEPKEEPDEDVDDGGRGKKTKVEWVERIDPGRFYLRVGLGRKASGSYYTPEAFVKFLVQETLGPQVEERSPRDDPRPAGILKLKVLDPAMGSGHFLVEACRFLGVALYEACRLCDERALQSEERAENASTAVARERALAEAADYRRRVFDLPDPDDELVRYLPSRAPEGEESGLSQARALALCRRMVAVHCLYGVDRNPLAVELARVSVWIESHAEGLPLTFLDHRLVLGDSLSGPFIEHLGTYPGTQQPMDDMYTEGLRERLGYALGSALTHVRDLEASVGVSLAELEAKREAKARLDRALAPFRVLAAAWSGGVMLGPEGCDDVAYADLARAVAATGALPERLPDSPRLRAMVARGLGTEETSADREALLAEVAAARTPQALPFELVFPEVFYPDGGPVARRGFDAVVGNPPWDRVRPMTKEFLAGYDVSILNSTTQHQRSALEERLFGSGDISSKHETYVNSFEAATRILSRLWTRNLQTLDGVRLGRGNQDQYVYFVELALTLSRSKGRIGLVLPAGIHANEGSTGLRRLLLQEACWQKCYCFTNARLLFDIGAGNRFDLVVAVASHEDPESPVEALFGLDDPAWLFSPDPSPQPLSYSPDFIKRSGGEYLSLVELTDELDFRVLSTILGRDSSSSNRRVLLPFGEEVHMSRQSNLFHESAQVLVGDHDPRTHALRDFDRGLVVFTPLHEKGTIGKFIDLLRDRPRFVVKLADYAGLATWARRARFYRLVLRMKIHSGEEDKLVGAVVPPGGLSANNLLAETSPADRPSSHALALLSILNSYPLGLVARCYVVLTLNVFILRRVPLYDESTVAKALLAHSCLRLSSNHDGFQELWAEQVGNAWREARPQYTWPVLEGDDARWAVRAAIDAVVANAYGLDREQYEHVLSTFSHKSYPKAPELCLAAFDELEAIGLEAFTRKHDPYWDIPLNESLPKPVIDLPIPQTDQARHNAERAQLSLDFAGEPRVGRPSTPRSHRPGADLDPDTLELIRLLLEERGTITSGDAQDLTGLDAAGVRPYLKHLVDTGKATTEGQRRGMRYRKLEE